MTPGSFQTLERQHTGKHTHYKRTKRRECARSSVLLPFGLAYKKRGLFHYSSIVLSRKSESSQYKESTGKPWSEECAKFAQ